MGNNIDRCFLVLPHVISMEERKKNNNQKVFGTLYRNARYAVIAII